MPTLCGITRARQQLDTSGREVLDMIVNDRDEHGWAGVSDGDVADSLTQLLDEIDADEPFAVSRYMVESHRNDRCSCTPDE